MITLVYEYADMLHAAPYSSSCSVSMISLLWLSYYLYVWKIPDSIS